MGSMRKLTPNLFLLLVIVCPSKSRPFISSSGNPFTPSNTRRVFPVVYTDDVYCLFHRAVFCMQPELLRLTRRFRCFSTRDLPPREVSLLLPTPRASLEGMGKV